jgi:16S rRNA (cytosine967-C5)-methyltransferase
MTPAARVAAAIEVLEKTHVSNSPADEVISAYFRGRRYIGSKDRRDISGRVYAIQRAQARLSWWTGTAEPRANVIAHLTLADQLPASDTEKLFTGEGYGPPSLSAGEAKLLQKLAGKSLTDPAMADAVRLEVPDWLMPQLREQFGENLDAELGALNRPASLDLRVNLLKSDCARALELLAQEGIAAEPTPLSPIGLRIMTRVNLHTTTAYKGGFVEPQDEASQIAALLCGARADQLTIDYCAGAGGKTLALAAAMKDGGPLIACDADPGRLRRIKGRLKRAGVSNVTVKCTEGNEGRAWLDRYKGLALRVLVDAPCTGSGAWRRNPAAKWSLTAERLDQYLAAQKDILAAAAPLVAPGGRLIYATCSVLPVENETQISAFLDAHPDFKPLPVNQVWAENIGGACPTIDAGASYLRLSPARHETDGFFVAILERDATP